MPIKTVNNFQEAFEKYWRGSQRKATTDEKAVSVADKRESPQKKSEQQQGG